MLNSGSSLVKESAALTLAQRLALVVFNISSRKATPRTGSISCNIHILNSKKIWQMSSRVVLSQLIVAQSLHVCALTVEV
jgi:hypothetical protein